MSVISMKQLLEAGVHFGDVYKRQREVYVLRKNASHRAFVIGIDDDCCLRVRYSDGSEELLSSGEVSINPNVAGEV